MHECLLCERDMKKSKTVFGSGCINNIFAFLDMPKPYRVKNKEQILYKNVMKRTHIYGINKNQKKWLTNRYLTYQYLDKLPYGNFDTLKIEIDKDIKNINKAKKLEDMSTSNEISLKQVYDLYKKEQKFEINLEKIKNNDFSNDEEIKLLFSSISFIFNLYRNKNQYEKDAFKAMQFAFWQTVVEVGRNYFDFDISADFMQHSLEEDPDDLNITEGKVIDEINKDNQFKEKLNEIVKEYGNGKNEFIAEGKDVNICFENSDLYFSIHDIYTKIVGKRANNKWNLSLSFHDTYDFTAFKYLDAYYHDTDSVAKSIFSSTLYNLAFCSSKLGVIKEYEIYINFDINDYEVIE